MARMGLLRSWQSTGLSRIDAEMSMEPARDPARNAFEMEDVGGVCDEDGVPDEQVCVPGLLPPPFSEAEITACPRRDEEVELAKLAGQGRREGLQNMRHVGAVFGGLVRQLDVDIETRTCSRFDCAEHILHDISLDVHSNRRAPRI